MIDSRTVDRNPIRKVLEYFPLHALPAISFRFKLEQSASSCAG